MEGHNGWNTIECLRGRLLAERRDSKVAKEQEESMCNKFNELEKKLREEIKLRDKAERKLKLLKQKLERFNVSTPSWQKCDSGEKCEHFCESSLSSATSTSRDSEANETKVHTVNPVLLEVHNHNVAQVHNTPSTTKDCDSLLSDTSSCDSDLSNPQIPGKTPNQSSDKLKYDESRLSLSSS